MSTGRERLAKRLHNIGIVHNCVGNLRPFCDYCENAALLLGTEAEVAHLTAKLEAAQQDATEAHDTIDRLDQRNDKAEAALAALRTVAGEVHQGMADIIQRQRKFGVSPADYDYLKRLESRLRVAATEGVRE